jgi:hypothetical protein
LISHVFKIQLFAAIAIVLFSLSLWAQDKQKSASHPAVTAKKSESDSNSKADAQVYRNAIFGFRYQIPYGWVDRTKEMQQGNEGTKASVLFAVFEHPPEATTDRVNSAVVIATESAASYPGLKKAEDYIGPLTELATAKGFKGDGDPSIIDIDIDARQLVRANFTKPLKEKLTMCQSTLVLLEKGQIVSFTFIAGTEDELDEFIEGLHFAAAKSAVH